MLVYYICLCDVLAKFSNSLFHLIFTSSLWVSRIGVIIVWHENKVWRGKMSCLRIHNKLFIRKAIIRIFFFSVLFFTLNIPLFCYKFFICLFSLLLVSTIYFIQCGYIFHYQRFIINFYKSLYYWNLFS